MNRFLSILKLVLFCGLLASCATMNSAPAVTVSSVAWLNQASLVEIEKAYRKDQVLYIQYRAFSNESDRSHVFYAKASWSSSAERIINFSQNLVVPLQMVDEKDWKRDVSDLKEISFLDAQHWQEFRVKLMHQLAMKENNQGVVIRSDEKEIIVYYDESNQLNFSDIGSKPLKVSIEKVLSQNDLSSIVISSLKTYLIEQEINDNELLMVTMEENSLLPFMYVDISEKTAFRLKVDDQSSNKYQGNVFSKSAKSIDHFLLKSHFFGMMARPVSSTIRLFSWTKGTAYDVVRPKAMLSLEKTPVMPVNQEAESMNLDQWEKSLNTLIGSKNQTGRIKNLIGGDEFFPRLIDAIQNAQTSIQLRTFIFDNDDYGVKIADILRKKSKEDGVKIQVLLDGMGQIMGEGSIPDSLPANFKPPRSIMKYLTKGTDIEVRVRPNAWFKADHTKTTIIDGKICFTGGMNIGREYRYDWHDLMMEVRGNVVNEIIKEFNVAWEHAGSFGDLGYIKAVFNQPKKFASEPGYPIRLLYTRLNDPQIFKAQIEAIKKSQKYIYISNSYFSDNAILFELIQARRRGVDVRVILPVNGNHEIMNASNIVTANVMFKHGIKVYFYPGMTHVKAAVYDGWLTTGSANFDKLSFRDNLELNIATSHPEIVDDIINRLFLVDFDKSLLMTEPLKAGLKERIAEFIAEQL